MYSIATFPADPIQHYDVAYLFYAVLVGADLEVSTSCGSSPIDFQIRPTVDIDHLDFLVIEPVNSE